MSKRKRYVVTLAGFSIGPKFNDLGPAVKWAADTFHITPSDFHCYTDAPGSLFCDDFSGVSVLGAIEIVKI